MKFLVDENIGFRVVNFLPFLGKRVLEKPIFLRLDGTGLGEENYEPQNLPNKNQRFYAGQENLNWGLKLIRNIVR